VKPRRILLFVIGFGLGSSDLLPILLQKGTAMKVVTLSVTGLAILQMIVASVLPIIVAYVTDSRASAGAKTGALIVLTVLTDVLTSILTQPSFEPKQVALSFFAMLFAAIAAHKGVTSNIGLSGSGSAPAETNVLGPLTVG
jgi:hypothetical protein